MTSRISVGLHDLPTKPHALYRFFDRTDVLLYVGITMDLPKRMGNHRKGKPWWASVDHITVEHFDSRREALDAEAEAIRTERPLWNEQHNEFVEAAAPVIDEDPCGTGCNADCRYHHGRRASCIGRHEYSESLIAAVSSPLDIDHWIADATSKARAELALDEGDRTYGDESDEQTIIAYEVLHKLIEEVWRYRLICGDLVRALPDTVRAKVEEDAAHDWSCAGEPDAPRDQVLPDVIRHVGYHISGRPKPNTTALTAVGDGWPL